MKSKKKCKYGCSTILKIPVGFLLNKEMLSISNKNIFLTTFKKMVGEDSFVLRLLNNSPENEKTEFTLNSAKISLSFGAFEAKTVIYNENGMQEINEMKI